MTGKVDRSALRQGLNLARARLAKAVLAHASRDLDIFTLTTQTDRFNQRYAAGSYLVVGTAIPILRKSRQAQQNRRPDGQPVEPLLRRCAKDLNTWAVRCLLTRHTGKKPGLSFFAATG